jgi:endonuclease YncB( thermonuclease family)
VVVVWWVSWATTAGLAAAVPADTHATDARTNRRPVPFTAEVTRVVDGDTVWVRRLGGEGGVPGGPPLKVRLQGLDAPERCQPGGEEARRALTGRLLGQPVDLRPLGQDDHGRLLARLRHRGDDVGAWLVGEGLAWSDGRGSSAGPYGPQQQRARDARRGVHASAGAIRPREFRRRFGPCDPPAGTTPRGP